VLELSGFSAYKLPDVLDDPSKPAAESEYSSLKPDSSSSEGSSLDSGLNLTLGFAYNIKGTYHLTD